MIWKLKPIYILVGTLLLLFLADKIFLIPEVRDRFMQPGGMVYYRHRLHQLDLYSRAMDQLSKEKSNVSQVVVLGDSRSFGIGTAMAETGGKKDVHIWNFAGPQAVPAYHLYLTQRILSSEKRPDAVIIGLSPDAMGRNAGIFASPVLNFGVDTDFIHQYESMIPDRDLDTYKESRRFALVGMQFSLRTLVKRIKGSMSNKDPFEKIRPFLAGRTLTETEKARLLNLNEASTENLSIYNFYASPQIQILDQLGGAQYAWFGFMNDQELKEETDRLVSLYLDSFVVSEEQMFYFEETLKLLKKANVPVIVFWPRVNPYLRQVYEKEPKISFLWTRAQRLAQMYGAKTVDLNHTEQTNCQHYYDASHLSIDCYPAISAYLLDQLGF